MAGAPCSDTHGGACSHSYILEEKRWGKGEENQWEAGVEPLQQWQCGCLGTVWHNGFGPRAAELEGLKTSCPLGVTMSFQLLPPCGCAHDVFGVQEMRWGPPVGKYPPCVFLPVILWLETGATILTDLGSLRLLGVMNTPRRGQRIWESLKHPSGSYWASWGLLAARKRHKQCSPPPLWGDSTAALATTAIFIF